MEREAGAIEEKAHEDYWNNADLIEQEQDPTIEEARQKFDNVSLKDAWQKGINSYRASNPDNFEPYERSIYRGKIVNVVLNNWANQLDEIIINAFSYIPTLFQNALLQLNSGFSAVMNALLYLIIVPFLVFFLLKDRDVFINYAEILLPKKTQYYS